MELDQVATAKPVNTGCMSHTWKTVKGIVLI